MEKLHFSIDINAPKEKVWNILWDDATYPQWTSVFCEGSKAITDWNEGSKVLFVDGKGSGMISKIEAKKDNEFMSFKHLGEVKGNVEDTTSEKIKSWAGALENYSLHETGGVTTLKVDMDIVEEFKDFFLNAFPGGLEKVKELSENH